MVTVTWGPDSPVPARQVVCPGCLPVTTSRFAVFPDSNETPTMATSSQMSPCAYPTLTRSVSPTATRTELTLT